MDNGQIDTFNSCSVKLDDKIKRTNFTDYLNTRAGVILFYSDVYDKYSISAAINIQRNFSGSPFLFVTDNKDKLKEFHPYPIANLPDGHFIEYESSKDNKMLRAGIKGGAYILIDDIDILVESDVLKLFNKINPKTKLIVLASSSVDKENVEKLIDAHPSMSLISTNFIHDLPVIDNDLNVVIMDPTQIRHYKKKQMWEEAVIEKLTNKDELTEREEARLKKARLSLYSKPITNFVYPGDIQDIYNSYNNNVIVNIPPDTDIDDHGWMTPLIVSLLPKLSPKFTRLLTIIKQHPLYKHVIYTEYIDHHGAMLISTLLNYINISNLVLTDENYSDELINNFNSGDHGKVLIINIIPKIPLKNIYHMHFVDGYDFETVNSMKNMIIKRRHYSIIIEAVVIHYYVCNVDNDELSIDGIIYEELDNHVKERANKFNDYIERSDKTISYEEKGLMVNC